MTTIAKPWWVAESNLDQHFLSRFVILKAIEWSIIVGPMESFAVDTIDCPLPPQGLLDFEFAEGVSRYARKASASQHS
jgi:hypothetical protein